MFSKIRNDEQGFTLIELLVVILIIGILAAIALPVFLGQQKKGQDASAKSQARNATSQLESCFTDDQTYVGCPAKVLTAENGIDPVKTTATVDASSYTITATSEAKTDGATHSFVLAKAANGTITRTCTPVGKGACPTSGNW